MLIPCLESKKNAKRAKNLSQSQVLTSFFTGKTHLPKAKDLQKKIQSRQGSRKSTSQVINQILKSRYSNLGILTQIS